MYHTHKYIGSYQSRTFTCFIYNKRRSEMYYHAVLNLLDELEPVVLSKYIVYPIL